MRVAHSAFVTCALATTALVAAFATKAEAGDGVSYTAQRTEGLRATGDTERCLDSIPVAPVVMMTKAGSGLLGAMSSTTIIYSNGLVLTSASDSNAGTSWASQALVAPQFVDALQRDLRELEAGALCDQVPIVLDSPLTTVTVFRGGQDARAHTFSYWIASDEYTQVDTAIMGFLIEHMNPE